MPLVDDLVYRMHHIELEHQGGVALIMGTLSRTYCIPSLRKVAERVVKGCFQCARDTVRPSLLIELPKHASRLGEHCSRAFEEIGIDHAGSFQVIQGRKVGRYILVIACCTTRAVSLEVCESTSCLEVVQALQRHSGTFCPPDHINNDNASGFVSAAKEVENRGHWFLGTKQLA